MLMLSSYFGEMPILYFEKFNFNYKDLEEYFHTLSVNYNLPVETAKQIYVLSHAINLHF